MRARRVDSNHSEIMKIARKLGLKVWDTSRLGGGFPDLVAAWGGMVELWEVKNGELSPSRRRLTDAENEFQRLGFPVRLVQNTEDVLNAARTLKADLAAINRARGEFGRPASVLDQTSMADCLRK